MKRFFITIFCLCYCIINCIAQRFTSERSFDIIGLADGDEISDCIEKGSPFLLIGLLILFICIRNSKQMVKENREDTGSWWGCLGLLLIGIGGVIMLPLLAWIEAIAMFIISVIFILAIVFLIWQWIKK